MTEHVTAPNERGQSPSSITFRRNLRALHKENVDDASRQYRRELRLVDSCITLLFDLLWIAQDKRTSETPVFWGGIRASSRIPDPDLLIECAFGGLTDTCLAARELAVKGLDSPARSAVRAAYEHLDFMLCLLGDRTFLDRFRACSKAPANSYQNWDKLLRPSRLRKTANAVLKNHGVPASQVKASETVRSEDYRFLSKAAHLDYEGVVCGNLRRESDDDNAPLLSACLGLVGPATQGTLAMLGTQLASLLPAVVYLLLKTHGWAGTLSTRQRRTFRRLHALDRALDS